MDNATGDPGSRGEIPSPLLFLFFLIGYMILYYPFRVKQSRKYYNILKIFFRCVVG
jgi:hypothetical protein